MVMITFSNRGEIHIKNDITIELNENDLLQYAISHGIINMSSIQDEIIMTKKQEYINRHNFKIWQGNNNKWYTYLPDPFSQNNRKLIKRSTKEAIYDAIVEYYDSFDKKVSIKDVFYEWAKEKLYIFGEISKQTYDRYETDFYRFFENTKLYNIEFSAITENMLETFIKTTIKEKKLTSKGWGNLRTLIKGIFKYGKKHNMTQISIYEFLGNLEISPNTFRKVYKEPSEEVFSEHEIEQIEQYINEHEISMISLGILFAFRTGLRAGEIAALKYSDLDGDLLEVKRTEIRYKNEDGRYVFDVRERTKGKKGFRTIILTDSAKYIFQKAHELNPTGEYLFMRQGYRIKGKSYTSKLYDMCDYLGIPRRSAHKARKTYGTKLLNARVNEKLIESQMGHNDISTTKGYYWYNNSDLKDAKNVLTSAVG